MARGPQTTTPERTKRAKRNPEFEIALGSRIREARIAAGMSQGALGEALGVSFQQVQKYELGKDRLAVSTLLIIAVTLGVHPGSFLDIDMPAPLLPNVDVRAIVKVGKRIQRVRDPIVMRRLLALADVLAEKQAEQRAITDDGTF